MSIIVSSHPLSAVSISHMWEPLLSSIYISILWKITLADVIEYFKQILNCIQLQIVAGKDTCKDLMHSDHENWSMGELALILVLWSVWILEWFDHESIISWWIAIPSIFALNIFALHLNHSGVLSWNIPTTHFNQIVTFRFHDKNLHHILEDKCLVKYLSKIWISSQKGIWGTWDYLVQLTTKVHFSPIHLLWYLTWSWITKAEINITIKKCHLQ